MASRAIICTPYLFYFIHLIWGFGIFCCVEDDDCGRLFVVAAASGGKEIPRKNIQFKWDETEDNINTE